MASNFTPTKHQQEVLDNKSNNLLVSASAGSGKTATIIQKILNLITKDHIDIQELLVITFTEASSLEMKIRLKEKLFEYAGKNIELSNQIDKIPTSDISTIHSFCSKCIRKYFFELGLNPNFIVLDANNSNFLKGTAINRVIEDYSIKQDDEFVLLSQIFGGGRNFSGLKENVLNLYEFFCSVEDREDYIKNIAKLCYEEDLHKNKACEMLNSYLLSNIYFITLSLKDYCIQAQVNNADYFVQFITLLQTQFEAISYKKDFLKNRQEILKTELPLITKKKLSEDNNSFKEQFKPFYDDVKKIVQDLKKIVIDRPIEDLSNDLKNTKKVIDKFLEIENEFEKHYDDLKQKRNALDFNDLEKYFLRLLKNEDIRKAISETYKYIFVDEYQDINNIQELILSNLTMNNNMVMVGDIKQSIYGFRNSTPTIFVNKSLDYSNNAESGTLINLNENFRSNPSILSFVNEIFNKCMSQDFGGVDYIQNGQLQGMTEYKKVNDIPIINLHLINTKKDDSDLDELEEEYSYPYSVLEDKNSYFTKFTMARKEAMIIAKEILNIVGKDYYDAKSGETKKITFGDIAILSRKNEFLKQVANVLMEYKIPITLNSNDNIYKDSDIIAILSILKIVNNFHDDLALSTSLTSFIAEVTFDELAIIRNKYSECDFFYESVKLYFENESDKLQSKLKSFIEIINLLRDKLVYCSIYEILNFLQTKYDFLSGIKMLPNGEDRYNTVKKFIDSFEKAEYNYDLSRYLDFVENYAKDTESPSTLATNPNSIKMGTIHSSKGLEYPVVFLVGIGKSFSNTTFRSEILKDKDYGLGLYYYDLDNSEKFSTLARNAITINLKKQEKAEELRLLYVALTRAKNHLIIIGSKNLNNVIKINSIKDAQAVNSFTEWTLASLSDLAFNSLKQGKTNFTDKHKLFNIDVNIYNDSFFEMGKINKVDLKLNNVTDSDVKKLLKSFDFIFEKSNNLALKNTVSSMLQEHNEEGVSLNFEPKKLEVSENKKEGIDASKLGTIYHNIMQKVDFNNVHASNKDNVEKIIDSLNIEQKYLNKVDVKKIINCINKIQNLKIKSSLKEQPFLSYLPYNKIFIKSDIKEKIIIQGVADLIVETEDGKILIDYKTTRANTKDQLVEKYQVQLKLYKVCLEKAMQKNIDKVYIYSFCFDDFIEIK